LLPAVGPIRISTVVVALAIVVVVLWRKHSMLTALITVMAWVSAYEILFHGTGVLMHGWSAAYFLWMTAAVAGWVVLSHVYGIVPDRWLLVGFAAAWLLWVLMGFQSNSPTVAGTAGFPRQFAVAAEVLNVATKTLLGAAYLLGALRSGYASRRGIGR
jgi:hypothetical protein